MVDVADEAAVYATARGIAERLGGFDTWVNNAGVGLAGPLKDLPTADHRRVFETNYWGTVYGSQAAAQRFRESGRPGWGSRGRWRGGGEGRRRG